MFELVTPTKRPLRERVKHALDWNRCRPLTRRERLLRALLWLNLGLAPATLNVMLSERQDAPPVNLLEPRIEHLAKDYTIYQLRLELAGVEKSCRFTVYHDRQTWRLECQPR